MSNSGRYGRRRNRRKQKKKRIVLSLILGLIFLIAVGTAVFYFMGGFSNPVEEGTTLLEQESYEKSITAFELAIKKDKNIGEAYRGMGIAYWELEKYEQSRDAFLKAIKTGAEKTGTMYNFLAMNEMKLGNFESALTYITQGLTYKENSKALTQEMEFNEISIYESMLDWENAKIKAVAYVEKYPDDINAAKEAEFLQTR